jgi:hypothetical protein
VIPGSDGLNDPRTKPRDAKEPRKLRTTAPFPLGELVKSEVRRCLHQPLSFECIGQQLGQLEDATDQLVIQLCTQLGMIMEDVCGAALTIGGLGRDARAIVIEQLETASTQISALSQAVKALLHKAR